MLDTLRWACETGKGFESAEQTEQVSRWALAEIERLRDVLREADRDLTAIADTLDEAAGEDIDIVRALLKDALGPAENENEVESSCKDDYDALSLTLAATEGGLTDLRNEVIETVTLATVILGGLTDVWEPLDYAERCARAENELRALLDRLPSSDPTSRNGDPS